FYLFFFFQAEDGIRDFHVTGVQTCALPIYGDKLFSSSNDVACPTSATTFHFTGSWSITGGTGRFEHSSGTGSVDVTGVETSSTSGTFASTVTGTITY